MDYQSKMRASLHKLGRPCEFRVRRGQGALNLSGSELKKLPEKVRGLGVITQCSCRSYSPAKGPGASAGAFPMALSLSGEAPRGPQRGAKGFCGTPGTPWDSSRGGSARVGSSVCRLEFQSTLWATAKYG
jgi:hypothetical protein